MVIYIYSDGHWVYSWEVKEPPKNARAVDLDKWFDYNLNELEVLACLEALEE